MTAFRSGSLGYFAAGLLAWAVGCGGAAAARAAESGTAAAPARAAESGTTAALSGTSMTLEQAMDLPMSVDLGAAYGEVKRLVPELGGLRPETEVGENEEALWKFELYGVQVAGEFNFHQGKLVSFFFMSEGLKRERAMKLFEQVRGYYARKHGEPAAEGEGVSDDARRAPQKTALWRLGKAELHLAWRRTNGDYRVSWGSQPGSRG